VGEAGEGAREDMESEKWERYGKILDGKDMGF
jgi:hypothetical protein